MDKKIIIIGNMDYKVYVEEYINSIKDKLQCDEQFFYSNTIQSSLNFSSNYIYIIYYPLDDFIINYDTYNKYNNIYFINAEQLSITIFYNIIQKRIYSGFKYIDYNIENCLLLSLNCSYIPYQYCDNEIDKLKEFCKVEPKYDIGIVGTKSAYRNCIVEHLDKMGIKYHYVVGWKDDRDKQIAECRILLNLHYEKDYQVFEHLRCDRWLFAGKMIISDEPVFMNSLDIKDLVIFEKYDKLVDKVVDVIDNYDKYYNDFINVYNK
jgi:hypothetical protein